MPREADVAVLLADIAGSTQLYEVLGDAAARGVVAQCIALMQDITRQHGGTPVKTTGDGVMARFPLAEAAASAACAMQDRITNSLFTGSPAPGGRPLAIRVGVHFGRALIERSDMFGDAVNLLARIAEEAKPGQILTTSEAVAHLSGMLRQSCRQIDRAQLRGRREPLAIYELVWDATEATLMPAPSTAERRAGGRLLLVYGAWQAMLRDSDPALAIGRGEQNDLVLPLPVVSRLHACIEWRNGRFVLTDRSANGTYVAADTGDAAFIHRDSHVLTGAGVLSLGEAPAPGSAAQIRYQTV